MPTTVEPSTFEMVEYDAGVIAALVDDLAARIGLDPSTEIRVEIDEAVPLGRNRLESVDPIHIWLEGGAIENPKQFRQFNPDGATDLLGRHLLRAKDRLDPDFGDPGPDKELDLPHRVAWDVYAIGRLVRAGFPANQQRWLYTFRNRHGFTDAADRAFDDLWNGDGLAWSQIVAMSDEASAQNPGKLARKPA